MRADRLVLAFACLLAAGLIAGCGGDSDSGEQTTASPEPAQSRPAPPKSAFPAPEGRSLKQLIKVADERAELVVEPAAQVFYPGRNRYPFGVFELDHDQVDDAEVALYYSRVPEPKPGARSKSGNRGPVAKAEGEALDQPAVGPFPASIESLATKPAFRAQTTSEDPEAARVVYSAEVDYPRAGEWRMAALIKHEGKLVARLLPAAIAGEFESVPRVGQRAPLIHTPTAEDVGGQVSKLTTRIPPDSQNEVDYADALGKEPILLLFATPLFCQSRVCGPVVDVAEQVKQEHGDEAAFIHMEIYNDNTPANGSRPQMRAFHLPSEPWLFAIDRRGIVRDVVEGAFGVPLMNQAVERAVSG